MTNEEIDKIIKIFRRERPIDDDFNMWLEPERGKELQWAVDNVIRILEQQRWRSCDEEPPEVGQQVLLKTLHFGIIAGTYELISYGNHREPGYLVHSSLGSSEMMRVDPMEWRPI